MNAEKILHIAIISLAILILGVQVGIAQGRKLQNEDLTIKYGYNFTN